MSAQAENLFAQVLGAQTRLSDQITGLVIQTSTLIEAQKGIYQRLETIDDRLNTLNGRTLSSEKAILELQVKDRHSATGEYEAAVARPYTVREDRSSEGEKPAPEAKVKLFTPETIKWIVISIVTMLALQGLLLPALKEFKDAWMGRAAVTQSVPSKPEK